MWDTEWDFFVLRQSCITLYPYPQATRVVMSLEEDPEYLTRRQRDIPLVRRRLRFRAFWMTQSTTPIGSHTEDLKLHLFWLYEKRQLEITTER